MIRNRFSSLLVLSGAGLLFAVCSDQSSGPTAPSRDGLFTHSHVALFTSRAPLDPYRINQPPDFMIHSRAMTDVVIQRLEFQPGPGAWHTHPGPTVVIVVEGQIKLERFTQLAGCTETEVFGPGQAYFEVGNEVHRAVVVSEAPVVLHVTRFLPFGAAISTPADDPGCPVS